MSVSESTLTVVDLRVEYKRNQLGVDVSSPRLSWRLDQTSISAASRGQVQFAYRILAATSPEKLASGSADLWDSGKVFSSRTSGIAYEGRQPAASNDVFWSVTAYDRDDAPTAASKPAFWRVGLAKGEWTAEWVHTTLPRYTDLPPAAYLRHDFTVTGNVKRATLFATALGAYEPYINGQRIGDHVLAPGWTDYHKRVAYQTFDVTGALKIGENAIGAIVGESWYSGFVGFHRSRAHYGEWPSLLAQLEIVYDDGSTQTIGTDTSWTTAYGPILTSDLLMGETYDARLDLGDWSSPGYDAPTWSSAKIRTGLPDIAIEAQVDPPVRVTAFISPLSVAEPTPGSFVFDLGQNFSGVAQLKVSGEAGQIVRIRYVEMLNSDGTVYTTNLRAAKATDTFICSGNGEEIFRPRFTFHGFRYIELTGYPLPDGEAQPPLSAVTGCVIESDTEPTGTFECSHPMVNQLVKNISWGQRGNFLSVPTDCPQRDERLGWMADAQIFIRNASYNRNVASFFTKWMQDIVDAQKENGSYTDYAPFPPKYQWTEDSAPAWADAGIIVPWTISQVYGDTGILRKHYESFRKWFDFLVEQNPDLLWVNRHGNDYGDWLSINADTDKNLLATAYFAYDASLMTQIAFRLGEIEDAERYQKFFEEIKAEFNRAYVDEDGKLKGDTQTAYVLALRFDLLSPQNRVIAAERLVSDIRAKGNHLSTGFVGVGYLCPVLSEAGYDKVAYTLLLNDTFPSWGYSIKYGATTIWERWDGWTDTKGFQTPDMNSFNHYSLGSVGEWIYRYVAGIDIHPSSSGFDTILLRPRPDSRLSYAAGTFESMHGKIESRWELADGKIKWSVVVPPNTTATAVVPTSEPNSVTEGGRPAGSAPGIRFERSLTGAAVYSLGSGHYAFEAAYAG